MLDASCGCQRQSVTLWLRPVSYCDVMHALVSDAAIPEEKDFRVDHQPSDHQPEDSTVRYHMAWNSRKATVQVESHLNFIEAQPQVLRRKKQTKVIVGFATGLAFSVLIWWAIAALVF
jgi:hypothetical protein